MSLSKKLGPIVDDGAPFSAVEEIELLIVSNKLIHNTSIEPKLQKFADYNSWQYGTGEH